MRDGVHSGAGRHARGAAPTSEEDRRGQSLGTRCGLTIALFHPSLMTMTAARPTSLPVPDVVGTAITGATAGRNALRPPRPAA